MSISEMMGNPKENTNCYFYVWDLHLHNDERRFLDVLYFSMTSLSTVGFGDRNAKSDIERIFCVIIFIFGTAIFSYIQTLFLEFTDSLTKLQAGLE